MRRLILGTAGHIDHGKTTLVRALTGIDTDRLPEEKARGITIDLGFAHLDLGDVHVGVVDVPGHEGLIRNMLAGATGIDALLLVVAADEGIMPQTREHLAIAQLLGVQRMVVALTKCDLVEAEWLALVQEEVSAAIPGAPVVAVSALNGAGLDILRRELHTQLTRAAERSQADLFRLPIDRIFTVHGTGTVVTGTVWSGRAERQQHARILPDNLPVRIRGIQSHGLAVEAACAGERAAFALVGVERSSLQRGAVLVTDDAWSSTSALTARVQMLGEARLRARQRVRLHLGTAEVMARVHVLAPDWIQLRLEAPIVARAHDRFVLRSYSPVHTIGGGVVAELGARKRLPPEPATWLSTILDGAAPARMRAATQLAGGQGMAAALLPLHAAVAPPEVTAWQAALPDDVVMVNDTFFARALLADTRAVLMSRVAAFHRAQPLASGIERAELLHRLPALLAQAALHAATTNGELVVQGSMVAARGFRAEFSHTQSELRDKVVALLQQHGLAPPSVRELGAQLGQKDVLAVLRLLEKRGEVVSVTPDLFVDAAAFAAAVEAVRRLPAGELPAADFKAALPVSRKYLIPLLECLDRLGVTRRVGDRRLVEPRPEPQTASTATA